MGLYSLFASTLIGGGISALPSTVLGMIGDGIGAGLFFSGLGIGIPLAIFEEKIFEKLGWNESDTEESSLIKDAHENTYEHGMDHTARNTTSNTNISLNQQPFTHPTPPQPVHSDTPANGNQTEIHNTSSHAQNFRFFAKKDEANVDDTDTTLENLDKSSPHC